MNEKSHFKEIFKNYLSMQQADLVKLKQILFFYQIELTLERESKLKNILKAFGLVQKILFIDC